MSEIMLILHYFASINFCQFPCTITWENEWNNADFAYIFFNFHESRQAIFQCKIQLVTVFVTECQNFQKVSNIERSEKQF